MGTRQSLQAIREARVLAAARELFGKQGYENTSVREIAQLAGVSVGTVANTGDKAELLARMFDENSSVALLGRLAMLNGREPGCFVDEMVEVFQDWFDELRTEPELVRDYCMALLAKPASSRRQLDESISEGISRRLLVHRPGLDAQHALDLGYTVYASWCMMVAGVLVGNLSYDEARVRIERILHTLTDHL